MHVIRARNINVAWPQAIDMIRTSGDRQQTRNGPAQVLLSPLVTVFENPAECVLLDPVRDANPFLGLFESLWLLAGRDDARWIDQFVSDFSARFAEPDGTLHGSYGHRWRHAFGLAYVDANCDEGMAVPSDQLAEVIRQIRGNPQTRQAVVQMWRPEVDLTPRTWKDRPCNMSATLRADRGALDMTVMCRSNDMVFGWGGSNPPQFSILQQYLAGMIGIPVGRYTVLSNNFHMYENTVGKADLDSARRNSHQLYPGTAPLVTHPQSFDEELHAFLEEPTRIEGARQNDFFTMTANPMFIANLYRNERQYDKALAYASRVQAPDWRAAAVAWLQRRAEKQAEKDS